MTPRRRLALVTSAALLGAAAAGCGVGPGEAVDDTSLLVTRDFGATVLVQEESPQTSGEDTVMRLLERNADRVEKRYGGNFVQGIDGVDGGIRDGRQVDWFFYVNGSLAEEGAASTKVREGDRVWWDHQDWDSTSGGVRAAVGSFPAPFTTGLEGKRYPVRVECVDQDAPACRRVRDVLVDLGVPASRGGLQTSLAMETLRVLVGEWRQIRGDHAARAIGQGPQDSGVFARPARDGRSIALLDDRGRRTRTLGPGSGLIAATQLDEAAPVWVVAGTDAAGLEAAAQAFDEGALAGRFAVAVEGGTLSPLPDRPR